MSFAQMVVELGHTDVSNPKDIRWYNSQAPAECILNPSGTSASHTG